MGVFQIVVFMYRVPVLPSIIKKFCTYELSDLGYHIVIADLTYVLDRKYDDATDKARISDDKAHGITYKKPHTFKEMESLVAEYCDKAFYFPMFSDSYETRKIYRLFTAYHVQYGCIVSMCADISAGTAHMPPPMSVFCRLSPAHLKKAFYNRVWRKIRNQKKAKIIGYGANGGHDHFRNLYPCGPATKELPLHTFDYENFLISDSYQHERKYCVFLDQYIPYHPDNIAYKLLQTVDATQYYKELNLIFHRIKKLYGLDIIVAAHPKADYIKKPVFSEDVIVKYEMTVSLVKNAELVLAHFSTAIDYAVMAWKPIWILKIPEIAKIEFWKRSCEEYARVLGLKTVAHDGDIQEAMLSVNRSRYHDFLQRYVLCNEQKKPCLWEKIMAEIN